MLRYAPPPLEILLKKIVQNDLFFGFLNPLFFGNEKGSQTRSNKKIVYNNKQDVLILNQASKWSTAINSKFLNNVSLTI